MLHPAPGQPGTDAWGDYVDATLASKLDSTVASSTYAPATIIGCKLVHVATYSLPSNVLTAIPWDGESWDTHAFHDPAVNPSRMTIPAGQAGYYVFAGLWAANVIQGTGASRIYCRMFKNGVSAAGGNENPGGVYNTASIYAEDYLAVGDYVEFVVYAPGGDTSLTSTFATLRKVAV